LLNQTLESFAELKPQKIHANFKYDKKQSVFVSTLQTISRNPNIIEEFRKYLQHEEYINATSSYLKKNKDRLLDLNSRLQLY